ncbi:MAG: HAMP domain-containing histidine kinase [Gammaproteobacteria bacterium]|nr:HAMP domain-containing histidine kinase [Gammaproteobacteria bacterium]MDH5728606.1 HAMP domain-containing histidine kinase [Gammaproteobacteria bacterium]
MFKTLYAKLVMSLVAILLIMVLVLIMSFSRTLPMFIHELNQRLNIQVAHNLIKENKVIENEIVNEKALGSIFMSMMNVHPAIEIYLVDINGKILNYSAPPGVVKQDTINLEPVHALLNGEQSFPIYGEDPRNPGVQKVFSVAPVVHGTTVEGYLYVVLVGQSVDSIYSLLADSYAFQFWKNSILGILAIVLLFGPFLFYLITRRLYFLNAAVQAFKNDQNHEPLNLPDRYDGRAGDEVDQLGASFRELSERLSHSINQLKHVDASRRELVANVSHDLRTPLASLQGYLETLKLKNTSLSKEEREKFIDIAFQQSKRLARLIDELFELASLEAKDTQPKPEPFSMSELLHDVSQKFQLAAENKQITINTDIAQNIKLVSADIGLIERVLENLIENAIKYTPSGGEVTLRLLLKDKSVITSIEDSGKGIPANELDQIFERFYRASRTKESKEAGTGLGLAIARRILQLHNSAINVKSQLNHGTQFTFDLPTV